MVASTNPARPPSGRAATKATASFCRRYSSISSRCPSGFSSGQRAARKRSHSDRSPGITRRMWSVSSFCLVISHPKGKSMKGFSRPPRIAPRARQTRGGGRAPTNGIPGTARHREVSHAESVSARGARRCAPRVSDPARSASHVGRPSGRRPGADSVRHQSGREQDHHGVHRGSDREGGPRQRRPGGDEGRTGDRPDRGSPPSGRDHPRRSDDLEHDRPRWPDRDDRLQLGRKGRRSGSPRRRPPSPQGGPWQRARTGGVVLSGSAPGISRDDGKSGRRGHREGEGNRVARSIHLIAFVTTNEGKFREVSAKLGEAHIKLVHEDRSYPEIQTDRLEKVVRFAATVLDDQIRGDYLIDDSGLFIDAFGGFPGVYSSYVYKRLGCAGILKLLEGARTRAATFETVFLLKTAGAHEVFHGACQGTIADAERGGSGFGFDPIFIPEGATKTFAEMSVTEKNAVSHRARAVEALVAHLRTRKES